MTNVTLEPLCLFDVERVRAWRNDPEIRGVFRTPIMLTEEQMAAFYRDVICDRRASSRYWAVCDHPNHLIAMAGLVNIEWENGLAEISLVVNPAMRGHGWGTAAVYLVLAEAFDNLGLKTVWGECYHFNRAMKFWQRIITTYHGTTTTLPRRKYWGGQLWDSMYFTLTCEEFSRRHIEAPRETP